MADPAEFSAAELDHLEDALEGLEFAPPSRETPPNVRHRLDDYRNILALSRAAMPMVEVPRGLLDGVLAQARAAAEVPAVVPAAAASPRPSLWAKVRRFALLPGVALAGTAALVLMMVERKPEADLAAAGDDQRVGAARADAKLSEAAPQRTGAPTSTPVALPAASESNADAAGTVAPADAIAAPGAVPPPTARPASPAPEPEPAMLDESAADKRAEKDVALPAEAGNKQEEQKLADAETPRWDIIARGDRARHRGDCSVARNEYSLALDDVDGRVRARAHAGLGLCDAARGDRSSADAAYKAARELDAEIAGFIDDERPRGAGTSAAKAKPKAAKAKADPPPQSDQHDPFE